MMISCRCFALLVVQIICSVSGQDGQNSSRLEWFDCNIEEGKIANPFHPCDHYFYNCHEGRGTKQMCQANLYFDVINQQCDYYYKILACSGLKVTAATIETTRRPHITTFASDLFDCSKREPGNYPDPLAKRPNCSNRFFTCSTGDLSPIVTYCLPFEDNLFYDPQRNRCDFFDNVFECSGIKRPEITSTSRQTTLFSPATTEIGYVFNCTGKPEGHYMDPRQSCSSHYFICAPGKTHDMICNDNLVFNNETGSCDRHDNVFECTGVHLTTQKSTPVSFVSSLPLNFDCKKKDDGLYADPDNGCARYFIQCAAGRLYKMPCGSNLVFDGKTCVYPKNVPACINKPPRRGINNELTPTTSLPDDTTTVKQPVDVNVDLAASNRKRRDVSSNETILNGSATVAGNETSFNQSAVSDETIMNSTTASGSVTTTLAEVHETAATGSTNETETGASANVTSTSATVNHGDNLNESTSTAASNETSIIHSTVSASNETVTTAAFGFNESTIEAGNETTTTVRASFNDSIVTAVNNETGLAHSTVSAINETATTTDTSLNGSTVAAIANETSLNHSTIAGADETATTVGHNETTHTNFETTVTAGNETSIDHSTVAGADETSVTTRTNETTTTGSFNETATATTASSSSFSSSVLASEAASTLGTIYPVHMSSSHVTTEPVTETYPKLTRRTYQKQTKKSTLKKLSLLTITDEPFTQSGALESSEEEEPTTYDWNAVVYP